MADQLSAEDLAELERKLEAGAPGGNWVHDGDMVRDCSGSIIAAPLGHREPRATAIAALIVASVNALPRLLAMIDAGWPYDAAVRTRASELRDRADQAEAEVERLRAAVDEAIRLIDEHDGPEAPFADHHKWASVRNALAGESDG